MEISKDSIETLISNWVNGSDKTIDTLNDLLADIRGQIQGEGEVYASYSSQDGKIIIFLTEYDSNTPPCLKDFRKISVGMFNWEDSFDQPKLVLCFDKGDGSTPEAIPNILYGTILTSSVAPAPPSGKKWVYTNDGVTVNAIGMVIKESVTFTTADA